MIFDRHYPIRLMQLLLVGLACTGGLITTELCSESAIPVLQSDTANDQFSQVATSRNVPTSGKKWDHRSISVYLDPSLPPMENIAVFNAMDHWNQASIIRFKQTLTPVDADIIISPSRLSSRRKHLTLGVTQSHFRGKTTVHSDIQLDYQNICKSQAFSSPDDVKTGDDREIVLKVATRVCEHELGHSLGLNHAKNSVPSVMRSDSSHTLSSTDIQAVRQIYD